MYFDYVLSKCNGGSIADVCSVFLTKNDLQEAAGQEFNGCRYITADGRLLNVVDACLQDSSFVNPSAMDQDSRTIYERCRKGLLQYGNVIQAKATIDYDRLFDVLVDCCWLLASIQFGQEKKEKYVNLLSDPTQISLSICRFLSNIHDSAVQDCNECTYISEAIKARNRFFTGLYPFKYERSRTYLSREIENSDLRVWLNDYTSSSIDKMRLFYGLTATSVLAEEIRRQLI